jgi:hypothetical protein
MPIRLENSGELLEHAGQEVTTRAKRMWSGFADFALQDNVLEVALGLMCVDHPASFASKRSIDSWIA